MANNQDSRPFVDLQKDSEEFVGKFVKDIEDCKSLLDAQITALICDPDSIGTSVGPKQNALVEFSKAKYDIFVKMKSFMNEKEKEWQKYMSEMKKLFYENVEIFLAGTKLEIKLPTSQYQSSSSGPKKSPGNRKTAGVTSSIYPIISTITQNIPVLSSPLRRKEVRSTEPKESFINFSHMDVYMETDESETDLNTSLSASKRKSSSEERVHSNVSDSVHDNLRDWKSRSPAQNLKRNSLQAPLNSSDISEDNEEVSEPEQSDILQPSTQGRGYKGRITTQSRTLNANGMPPKNAPNSEIQGETHELESVNSSKILPKGRNRRGKQSILDSEDNELHQKNITGSEDSEEIGEVDQRSSRINSRKSIRVSSRSNNAVSAISTKNNISEKNEEVEETETSNNIVAVKGRRGRQAVKTKANAKAQREIKVIANKDSNSISDESEGIEETETNNNVVLVKGGRQTQATRTKANAKVQQPKIKVIANKDSNSISDESEDIEETETNNDVVPVKGGRGKQAAKTKTSAKKLQPENEVISKKNNDNISDESEEVETETSNNVVPVKGRGRRKQTAKNEPIAMTRKLVGRKSVNERVIEADEPITMTRKLVGRKSVNERVIEADEPITMTRKLVGRKSVNERVIEAGTSVSPKKVTFTAEEDSDDDLDVCVSVARPTKSAARRKTLFSDLEEAVSGADIIPGNSTRARSKRKTISGVADLTSVAPSKRLKASRNQKSNATAQDEGAADDDNLLEINDSYSEWIPLKNIDGKVPATPAIYEVKVWRAKKSAFIGSCDSLRQKLTLHKLRQNSGHKHLDKFIERNFDDIQVRYEVVPSLNDAKVEVKNRINFFVAQHKTTPAYN